MKKICSFFIFSFLSFPGFTQLVNSGQRIEFLIRSSIEKSNPDEELEVAGNPLFSSVVMAKFYPNREFEPAWSKSGKLLEIAYEMRYEILQARFDGLNPLDYHLNTINFYFQKYESNMEAAAQIEDVDLASLDVLLTDAYIMLSSHLFLGKVNPESLKTVWNIQRSAPELRIDLRLQKALSQQSLRKSIEELYPSFSIYNRMRVGLRELFDYQQQFEENPIADWKELRDNKSIKQQETSRLVPDIRNRLIFWGYLHPYDYDDDNLYDSLMEPGIKKLQMRHGLIADGVIGQGTFHALNQTPDGLISTASVNMERLRWLPENLKEQELVLVNTANFQLDYILKRDTLFSSKVIIGRSYHSTPQFSALMSYLVFSPNWTVPTSIIRNEIIPAAKKDPSYFAKKNMQLLTRSGAPVDPSSINWLTVNPRSFPFMVRQLPGNQNALGLVKFMFPNKYSVYIHDTPSRSLFEREDRALSHGCIRLQNPAAFAKLLLASDPQWTDEKIQNAMRQKNERTVVLDRKIPVVIFYLTYWANSRGEIFFRKDVYNRDSEIYNALRKKRGD